MNFQHFRHPSNDVGSCVSVWLDPKAGLVKRIFQPGMPTSNGQPSSYSEEELTFLFENELKWLVLLDPLGVTPKLIDANIDTREVIQAYTGPDLLTRSIQDPESLSNESLCRQVLDIYQILIEDFGILKLNGARSNMCLNGEKLLFFDFKWATALANHTLPSKNKVTDCLTILDDETYSYRKYIAKIDLKLSLELERRLRVRIAFSQTKT